MLAKICSRCVITGAKPINTPVEQNLKLVCDANAPL